MLNLTRLGWGVVLPVVVLVTVGLACIHVTDRSLANATQGQREDGYQTQDAGWLMRAYRAVGPLTTRQILYLLTGIGMMLLVLVPSYQKIGWYAYPIYTLAVVLLLLLAVGHFLDKYGLPSLPFVPERRGTYRWIGLGPFQIQPSEFMKVALILCLARYLRFRSSYRRWAGLVAPFLLTLLPMVLILFQPDLGTLLMLLPVLFAMLFVAGARLRHLALIIVILGCATMPAFYFYGMKPYQRAAHPGALQAGHPRRAPGTWTRAISCGSRRSRWAPAASSARAIGQGVFVEIRWPAAGRAQRLHLRHHRPPVGPDRRDLPSSWPTASSSSSALEVAVVTNDPFGRLLAIGVIVMIVVQALLNMCMTIGLAPITGMTLPFVSAGGSSLWANFIALGLLLNVAQRRPLLIAHPPFEFDDDED